MIEKRDVLRYLMLGLICTVLISILLVLRGGFTGFAVFEDSGSGFEGTFLNTTYNGSAVVLNGGNLTGSYESEIFDAGANSSWNNISWASNKPNLELIFCVDGGGDVYKSTDSGVTWILSQEDYGRTTDTQDMFSDNNYLYIISASNKEVWRSDDGTSFSVINNSFTTNGLKVGASNSSILFIATGPGVIYRSYDSGINWEEVGDVNGDKTEDPKGIDINSSNSIFVVDGKGRVEMSLDAGINWIEQTGGYGGGSATDALQVNSSGSSYILLDKKVYNSNDNGISWNVINNSFTWYANDGCDMLIDSNDNIFIVDCTGRVFKSLNSGISWTEVGDCNLGATNDPKGITEFSQQTSLDFQIRSCNDNVCSGESWIDITDTSPQDLSVNNNQYFQYKVLFTSPDSSISPNLESVTINYTILNTAPFVSIILPQDGGSYGYNESLSLNFSVSDAEDNVDSCWYNINDGDNVSLSGCNNISFNITGNGDYVISVYVNDTQEEEASDSVSFSVLVGAPTVILHYPINVYLNNGENIEMNYTPTDIDLDSCELWGDFKGSFGLNQTDSSLISGSVNNFILNLSDGTYLWNIRCNDSLGNSVFNGNKTFYVDRVAPSLSLSEPTGAKTSRTISLSFSASDEHLNNCWYNVYRGNNVEVSNTSIDCSGSGSFSVTLDADFIFNLYVNDSAGNSNYTNSSFSVDTSSTPSTPDGGGSGGGGGGGGVVTVSNITKIIRLELSGVEDIVAQGGDKKTLSLNAKNIGSIFLNNCRLIVGGDVSSLVYSEQKEGIAPGENAEFIFDLNVPERIEKKDYSGELEISCDEGSKSQDFKVSIGGLGLIEIKEIKHENEGLNISYVFDNSNVVGSDVSVEIWIVDEDGIEVKRFIDSFSINKEGVIERNILVELPDDLAGIYSVYFALSSELDNFERQTVVLGKTAGTGFAVFDTTRGKMIGYIVFIVIVGIGVFFVVRRHYKDSKKKTKKSKNHWLIRKKGWFS